MAEVIVELCRIDKIQPHPNADALELAQIKDWQCVAPIGKCQADDCVTYNPIDAMIPAVHSDRWGITRYLSVKTGTDAPYPPAERVRCARLRARGVRTGANPRAVGGQHHPRRRSYSRVGRVALKYIGDAYLFSKSADRDTHDV